MYGRQEIKKKFTIYLIKKKWVTKEIINLGSDHADYLKNIIFIVEAKWRLLLLLLKCGAFDIRIDFIHKHVLL